MTEPLLITALILLTLASGYFSASETALFSLSSMKARAYRKSPDPRKNLIARLVSQPQKLLVTILMLNVLVNILVQNIASNIFSDYSSWVLSVGIPLVLTLIFGEVIPKSLAIQNNERFAYYMAPVIYFAKQVLRPLRALVAFLSSYTSHFFFFFLRNEKEISQQELLSVLQSSKEQGILHQDELHLISGYLSLQETQVKMHMRPREEVLFYNIHEPLDRLLQLFTEEECTRVPVCDKDLDNILGIISAKQFLIHRERIHNSAHLIRFLQKPVFIPESAPAKRLLQVLEEVILALVVDEYGSISGLVTHEDLVEEVIGEIDDLRDEKQRYTNAGKNVIITGAKLELTEFKDIFGVSLVSQHNLVTLGGWLIERMGGIPKTGEHYIGEGFLFHILSAEPHRIRRIYIRRLDQEAD